MSITLQSELTNPLSVHSYKYTKQLMGPKDTPAHSVLAKFFTQQNIIPTCTSSQSPFIFNSPICKYISEGKDVLEPSLPTKTEVGRQHSYPLCAPIPGENFKQPTFNSNPSSKHSNVLKEIKCNKRTGSSNYHTLPIIKKSCRSLSLSMKPDSLEHEPISHKINSYNSHMKEIVADANLVHDKVCDNNVNISDVSTSNNKIPYSYSAVNNKLFSDFPNSKISNIKKTTPEISTDSTLSITHSPNKRPVFLNIGSYKIRHGKGNNKASIINYSLPESPVYEDLHSPTSLFQNLTDTESTMKSNRFLQTRRSCSYFIDLNTLSDKEQKMNTEKNSSVTKSSESLPATIGRLNASSSENLLDSCDENDEGEGNFSSDSLEEPSEFSSRTPRRCVSDYQIFSRPSGSEFDRHSLGAIAGRSSGAYCSQESILSDLSGQLSSRNDSGDILDMCNQEQERHSSASFFLSLRRASQESILTDDDFQQRMRRDSCQSVEGILDHSFFHRNSCRSTESILTDDSDCQKAECGFVNKGFDMVINDHEHKYKSLTNETYVDGMCESSGTKSNTTHQSIFRTRSLQDTSSKPLAVDINFKNNTTGKPPIAPTSRPQTPSKYCSRKDENLISQFSEAMKPLTLFRKNSYPRSRPVTPTSLHFQTQFKSTNGSDNSGVTECNNMEPSTPNTNKTRNISESNSRESPGNSVSEQIKCKSSYRPPTAPKPVGKVIHKPPLKPRQKVTSKVNEQNYEHTNWKTNSHAIHNNHNYEIRCHESVDVKTNYIENVKESNDNDNTIKNLNDTANLIKRLSGELRESVIKSDCVNNQKEQNKKIDTLLQNHNNYQNMNRFNISSIGVKMLCKSFENAAEDLEMSDECVADLEEDSFPVTGGGSGSSTPATSSSAANSPKRMWPPASRAPVQRHMTKRLQLLPSKYSAGTQKPTPCKLTGMSIALCRSALQC